jgi:hypothetical protein
MEPWTRVDQAAEDARAGRTTGDWHSPEKMAYRKQVRLGQIREILGVAASAYACEHLGEVITGSVGDGSSITKTLWRRCTIDLERRNCTGKCSRYMQGYNPSVRYIETDEPSPDQLREDDRRRRTGCILAGFALIALPLLIDKLR